MLEFRDEVDPAAAFTCGIGFEAAEADTDVAKLFFVVPGASVTEVEAVTSSGNGQGEEVVRPRSEEHTSELQSRLHLVCRLLLEKKKKGTKKDVRQKLIDDKSGDTVKRTC